MQIVIFGHTGSGKSHKLKEFLDKTLEAVDLDEYIYKRWGEGDENLGELIRRRGEAWFRGVEQDSLLSLLKDHSSIVISLGGGTLTTELIDRLQEQKVKGVFVDVDFETCWSRIKVDDNRIIVKKGKEYCKQLFLQRDEIFKYAQEKL